MICVLRSLHRILLSHWSSGRRKPLSLCWRSYLKRWGNHQRNPPSCCHLRKLPPAENRWTGSPELRCFQTTWPWTKSVSSSVQRETSTCTRRMERSEARGWRLSFSKHVDVQSHKVQLMTSSTSPTSLWPRPQTDSTAGSLLSGNQATSTQTYPAAECAVKQVDFLFFTGADLRFILHFSHKQENSLFTASR